MKTHIRLMAQLLLCCSGWFLIVPLPCADATEELQFHLPSTSGEVVTVDASKITSGAVIAFLGNECPLAKLYSTRLNKLSNKFDAKGISFFGVNSNQQDSLDELKAFKHSLNIRFALLKDYDNRVADQFGATRTPEVFLLNTDAEIVYRGAIDNQYSPGITRASASKHYLLDAIEGLLEHQPIAVPETPPEGCLIGRVKKPVEEPTVTYCQEVSRIFQNNCLECHRKSQIGPFSLEEYDEAKGWAEMIVEVVENGRMPPWHATDEHQPFTNARHLSERTNAI